MSRTVRKTVRKWWKRYHRYFAGGILVGFLISLAFYGITRASSGWKSIKNAKNKAKAIAVRRPMVQPIITPIIATQSATIRLPIVMFHYVEYVVDQNDTTRKRLDIVPDVFERQLKTLKEANYETFFVKDVPNFIQGKKKLPDKSVVLTFDDGYEDFYKDAFPLLKKYQMKATIYVINDFVNRRGFLTDKELKELSQSNLIEIGAHTLDHLYLKSVPKGVAEHQIIDSKKGLENKLHLPVVTFAYPYGAFKDETIDLVKEASFSAAVSVIPGVVHDKASLFILTRIRAGALTGSNMLQVLEDFQK